MINIIRLKEQLIRRYKAELNLANMFTLNKHINYMLIIPHENS